MAVAVSEVEKRISEGFDDAQFEIEGEDCNFTVTVISQSFEGLTPVAKQQRVLALFSDLIQAGDLHALTVKAFTLDEWNAKNSSLVQLEG